MRQRAWKGYTVVEIMVCLIVMSVVVIGASGMLLQSGRLARNAAQTAQASVLASELAALLRLRLRVGTEESFPSAARQFDFELAHRPASGSAAADCRLQACSASESLDFELNDWATRAAAVLPAGRLVLCRDLAPWDAGVGRFQWTCGKEDSAPLLIKLGWRPAAQGVQAGQGGVAPLLVMAIE